MNKREKIIKRIGNILAILLAIGIIVGILGGLSLLFGIAAPFRNNNSTGTKSSSDFFDNVTSLEIDAFIYEVNILKDDIPHVQVECNNVIEDYIVEQDADGSLHLYGKGVRGNGNRSDALARVQDFLDGKIPLNENWNSSITIIFPEDYKLEDCEIFGGTGAINISDFICDSLDLDLGTGSLTGDDIECNEFDLDSGTGNITLTNVVFHETNIDCETGLLDLSGRLLGDTDITCEVGKLNLTLKDYEENYNINIKKGLGTLTVNGATFNKFHSSPPNASHYLEIEGGIGDINIDFVQSF